MTITRLLGLVATVMGAVLPALSQEIALFPGQPDVNQEEKTTMIPSLLAWEAEVGIGRPLAVAKPITVPEENGWEHFFQIVGTHGNATEETGPLYLKATFGRCKWQSQNRFLVGDEPTQVIQVANRTLAELSARGPKSTREDYARIIRKAIDSLEPGLRQLIRWHIFETILPNAVMASDLKKSQEASPSLSGPMMGDYASVLRLATVLYGGAYQVTASTAGGLSYHQYQASAKVTSPKGRTKTVTGMLMGTGYAQATLPFDPKDYVGVFTNQVQYAGYCTMSHANFILSDWTGYADTLSSHDTYYKWPNTAGGGCYYTQLACSSGTPMCVTGFSIDPLQTSCDTYKEVEWLVLNNRTCSFVGLSQKATGPGPCN